MQAETEQEHNHRPSNPAQHPTKFHIHALTPPTTSTRLVFAALSSSSQHMHAAHCCKHPGLEFTSLEGVNVQCSVCPLSQKNTTFTTHLS
jgi:hypothetical protein